MAHFAKLGVGNKVVKVHIVSNDIATTEQAGVDFLKQLHKTDAVFKQTSYNTRGGIHYTTDENGVTTQSTDQSKAFRKNYAGIGYKYDQTRDAFIPPQPFNSWTLNETTCLWDPPVVKPELTEEQINNGQRYSWNETNQTWDLT